jgi:eukaryotic-like serine/threonine-protein kinase
MQLPARIGKYELEEFLGGGMSHVYRARDTVIGRTVAVKILTEAGCADAEAKARFLAEARMAGNISHDNVLSIYDFGEDEQHRPFMVMEFLRGEDLRHAIKNGHLGDLKGKLKAALQVARALEYIHTQKIIHRDIKPENVHISASGVVKLMDFGIAKTEGLAMTRAGYVLGTPYYMAPEQVTGQGITEQVDVYAFGVLLFEVLSGVKPISGDTVERIFYSILNEPLNLEPLHKIGVPEAVCDLVARCTAKTPAARPQGFAPVCAALERVISGLDAATQRLEPGLAGAPPAKSANWKWIAAAAAVLVAAPVLYFALHPAPAVHKVPAPVEAKTPALASTLALPGGDMVLIPEGAFLFGKDNQPTSLPAFYIDKTEVTNAAYSEFCKASGRPLPNGFPPDKPDYPVVNVSFVDAHAFADWAGKRMPSGKEWEKAARGTDGRLFPWGNDRDPSRANVHTNLLKPANDYPAGASPFGVLQMVGNVWELLDQLGTPSDRAMQYFTREMKSPPSRDEPWYTIRGLSFTEDLQDGAAWDSTTVPARWKNSNIGFRCAKDAR